MMPMGLSSPRRSRLKAPLDTLYRDFDWAARTKADAIQYPLRYPQPHDRELAALLASCLAYGRVDLFGPQVEWVLDRMGASPYRFVLAFDPAAHGEAFAGFRYRFNRPHDLVAFCVSGRRILEEHGSLGAFFAVGFSPEDETVAPALERFVAGFLEGDLRMVFPRGRLSYG